MRKRPTAPGRLILQDKWDVIAQISGNPDRIEMMAYNFFIKQQPIPKVKAFFRFL
jgi:hypothetical protein